MAEYLKICDKIRYYLTLDELNWFILLCKTRFNLLIDEDTELCIVKNIEVLNIAIEYGYKCTISTSICAATANNFEIIKFLLNNNCPINEQVYMCAISIRNVEMLKYIYSKTKYPFSEKLFYYAVFIGHIPTIEFLHEIKAPHSEYLYEAAIFGKAIDAFKFLHNNGYATKNVAKLAKKNKSLEILKYINNECPSK